MAPSPVFPEIRKSRRSRWRAGVLIGVHALIAAHITHFLITRKTLSPIEPSEAMYTLELGYVNCGFIFFAIALVGTLIFGRFFCGWACHIVALQDLCGWMMKKLGVRPRPFRSRLLALAPIALAFYMFGWPTLRRLVLGGSEGLFPGFTSHITTTGFWATFPGPSFAILTMLTCGFAAVYFLGAKGFCTYGCPYGAMFGVMDRLSPGRIVVSDSCEQCGHCTATCTSNVRVHEEVKLYGMVVDPGCMKCMDCISVCPKGALSYAIARPLLFKGPPTAPRAKKFDLPAGEEILAGAVCLVSTVAFRGLYDGPPLLMSIGLGALTGYASLKLWQLFRHSTVRLQNLPLRIGSRIQRSGRLFAGMACIWLLFTAHSGFVQWHRAWGRHYLDRTEAARADLASGELTRRSYSPRHSQAAAAAFRHFGLADRWGLVGVVEVKLGLAWCLILQNELAGAERLVREAMALAPDQPNLHQDLFDLLVTERRIPEAIEVLRRKVELEPASFPDRFRLAGMLAETERFEEAATEYSECVRLAPASAEARYDLGGLLRRLGRRDAAIEQLTEARRLAPGDADTHIELGLAYMESGRAEPALEAFRRAIELNPDSPESKWHLPDLIRQLGGTPAVKGRG